MKTRKILGVLLVIILWGTLFYGFNNFQNISDWWRLRTYAAPNEIATLSTNISLNDKGRKLFYVYYPSLEDKTTFREKCSGHEQSIVLGCYISRTGLYILDVTDERIAGVEEVTAAHEMLHVAYERLDDKSKNRVNDLLRQQEDQVTDVRIKGTITAYRNDPSSDIYNELHSIFGTEVSDLLPELEEHYKQYFVDRSRVVGYANGYAQAFLERENKIREYDEQLSAKKQTIDALNDQIGLLNAQLDAERENMQTLRNADPEAFNSRVDSYNSMVRRFNVLIDRAKKEVDQYNLLVAERNAIADEEQELIDAIDTRAQQL
ncbi:MAG: hypothetical protein M3Q70_01555 [bacterium]|nr:hypothetical protein [bacterium]